MIINRFQRHDISFTLMGSGDCFDDLLALRDRLHLGEYVEFTGRVPDETVAAVLSTADVGLSPDPKNPLNDLSTMNKTMEYMAFGLPVVAFDLRETRASAADAGIYADPNEASVAARLLVELVDDEPWRQQMGAIGRAGSRTSLPGTIRQAGTCVCTRASSHRGSSDAHRPRGGLRMCGIAGTYQQVDGEAAARLMSSCLAHRGPDDEGLYSFVDDRVSVHLAHRRLSIIDLANGHQPLVKHNLALSYNGELYNYRELRSELALFGLGLRYFLGHRSRARGMEALVPWLLAEVPGDVRLRVSSTKRAARSSSPGTTSASSRSTTCAARTASSSLQSSRRSSRRSATSCRSSRPRLSPRSSTTGCRTGAARSTALRKLQPGTWAEFRPDGTNHTRTYFDIAEVAAAAAAGPPIDLGEVIEESVAAHLVADVPVSSFLSGGLDSGIVTVLAKQANAGIDAYTITVQARGPTPRSDAGRCRLRTQDRTPQRYRPARDPDSPGRGRPPAEVGGYP